MNPQNSFSKYPTITRYLDSDNETIHNIVALAANNVLKAAHQSIESLEEHFSFISDVADHLDNKFVEELGFTQADEINEINKLENEFFHYYNDIIWKTQFGKINKELMEKAFRLENLEKELLEKEAKLEEAVRDRVAEAEDNMKEIGTSSRHFLNRALNKAVKVVDQNKVTRFACSTISMFHEEFTRIVGDVDVNLITQMFQETIEPFQSTRVITDKDGNKIKVVNNTFPEECYHELFFFFYTYYKELLGVYSEEENLPSIEDELVRIFQKRKMDAADIIKDVYKKCEAKQRNDQLKG